MSKAARPAFAAAIPSILGARAYRNAALLVPARHAVRRLQTLPPQQPRRHASPSQPARLSRGAGTRTRACASRPGAGRGAAVSDAGEAQKARGAPGGATRPLRLLWDSDCPLCVAEVDGLKRRAAAFAAAPVEFVDVAAAGYEARADNGGVSYEAAMGRIHAVTGDGEVISGVEVFRRVYEALGMGWVYAPTRVPVIGALVERVYDVWADNRLRLTGRPTLEELVQMREKAKQTRERGDGTCR